MLNKVSISLCLLFASVALNVAMAQTDSLYMSIDSVTFISEKTTSSIQSTSMNLKKVDMKAIQGLPQILGNTDPLHFVKLLPGVQTTTELNSGIYIRGCDMAHNDMSISGVPVFGVNHLLGLFSAFNSAHYDQMTFSNFSSSNRLGGALTMELPDTLKKRWTGDFSLGMVSAQASVGARLGRYSHLKASFRQSYINLFFSRWMKIGDDTFHYNFGDYNLTWLYSRGKDKIWTDFYLGMDNVGFYGDVYGVDFGIDWGNYKGAVHWSHKGDHVKHNHCLYSSGYGAKGTLTQVYADVRLPSYIIATGYKGDARWSDFKVNTEINWYRNLPQVPITSGATNVTSGNIEIQNAVEVMASAGYSKVFADQWSLRAGLKGTCYRNFDDSDAVWRILPEVSLSYDAYSRGRITASYGWSQQNIFYTGLSSSGLPVEFWFVAGKYSDPQYAQWLDLSYDLQFCRNMFAFSGGIYAKQLFNQVEYRGDIMDFFTTAYNLDDFLLKGSGYNIGLNLMLHKQSGKLTGWLSYSLGRALRRFDNPDYSGWYPANHERIHELNAVCSYDHNQWNFSGTFVYATGLPFTAPKSFYLSSGQLIAEFGRHNACRMRPYIRLDLSVSYDIISNEKCESGINLSIVNALARKNDIIYKLKMSKEEFWYYRTHFLLTIIPSISYYHRF